MNVKLAGREQRHLALVLLCALPLLLFRPELRAALTLSFQDDRYLPVIVAPLMSVGLILWLRAEIFRNSRFSPGIAIPPLVASLLLSWVFASRNPHSITAALPLAVSIVAIWLCSFLLCYGLESFRAAIYPLGCLFLAVPLPVAWLDKISVQFQAGSAAASYAILGLIGVPVLRQGTTFTIPGLSFNIAPECSGIRSALAFVMVALLAARLFLRYPLTRWALIVATVPIAIVKNAVRIVVITTLGAYVDRAFIDGPFHHQYSGLIFAPLDFLLFLPVLIGLAKIEKRIKSRQPVQVMNRVPEDYATTAAWAEHSGQR